MNAPRLPDRTISSHVSATPDPDGIPDEPPPAYEPTPSTYNEQTLEYGPLRPFQPPPHPPPPPLSSPHPAPPPRHYSTTSDFPQRRPSRSHRYQQPHQQTAEPDRPYQLSPTNSNPLPPPTFPFWNGSSLTPAQTGFQEGPSLAPFGSRPVPPPSAPPLPTRPPMPSSSPPAPPTGYEPTTSPTPGQPLLHNSQLLVYPVSKLPTLCSKCSGTGYKPFDPYSQSGYQGDDPSHPCKKCWSKFGKPFNSVLRISTKPTPPSHYQRPLRLFSTPAAEGQRRPPPPPQVVFTNQRPHLNVLGNSLVVRPGDPRIGGVLCRTCGGDGLMMGPFIFDEVTCTRCMGTGRVF
ncbi:hypothetical protein JCM5350_000887 [Sporobolomyces pararoseus]